MKHFEDRLRALEHRVHSTNYLQRMEERRNSPDYRQLAEDIRGLSDEDKAALRKELRARLQNAGLVV